MTKRKDYLVKCNKCRMTIKSNGTYKEKVKGGICTACKLEDKLNKEIIGV